MRREIEEREPERDPALAAALLDAYGEEPPSAERLAALRARIRQRAVTVAAAAPAGGPSAEAAMAARPSRFRRSFAAVRRNYTWAAPALLAATVAGVLLLGRDARKAASPTPPAVRAMGYASPEQALTSDVSDAEFARTVRGDENPAALLAIAVEPAPVSRRP